MDKGILRVFLGGLNATKEFWQLGDEEILENGAPRAPRTGEARRRTEDGCASIAGNKAMAANMVEGILTAR